MNAHLPTPASSQVLLLPVLVPTGRVHPSAYNPRRTDPERLNLIQLSLSRLGFLLPLYAQPEGELLSGHQRHLAAKAEGCTHVPVQYTEAMPLDRRKAVNIVFNRATNDLESHHTPQQLTAHLQALKADLLTMASELPKLGPDTDAYYPCLRAELVSTSDLLAANRGRFVDYAHRITSTLAKRYHIEMPIIARRDGAIVNGIGRLEYALTQQQAYYPVVYVSDDQAAFARAMLNYLSMDFDVGTRYGDVLRHNSFRRGRQARKVLGQGFLFAVHRGRSKAFDLGDPGNQKKWKAHYGSSVLDFGAGHLHETQMLRAIGVDVTPFEPYRLGDVDGKQAIDKAASLKLVDAFLKDVANGKHWDSLFLSSVLNSVPFQEDRAHIACLLAALASPTSTVYACATNTTEKVWRNMTERKALDDRSVKSLQFRLGYEEGITLGDFQEQPKIQKRHTPEAFRSLFAPFFQEVQVQTRGANVLATCRRPRRLPRERIESAIRFEFDLPYPDGSRLGRAHEALAAFAKRLFW